VTVSPSIQATADAAAYPAIRLAAADLDCVRGERMVFSGLNFVLNAGQLMAAIGPNGSGKSSLLRLIAGLLRPAGGSIGLSARDPGADPDVDPDAGPDIGLVHYLGHLDGLKRQMSIAENLRFWRQLYGGEWPVSLDHVCAVAGVGHLVDVPVAILSAGQRRRVGLARLLISPRPLWLLDEPLSALDADGSVLLGKLMVQHLAAGGAIIAATHQDLPVAADQTIRIEGGRGVLVDAESAGQ